MQVYAKICGAVLAQAHARGGSPSLITGYLGTDETLEQAITEFATGYSSLNMHDYDLPVDSPGKAGRG